MTAAVLFYTYFVVAIGLGGLMAFGAGVDSNEDTPPVSASGYGTLAMLAILWPLVLTVAAIMLPFAGLFFLGRWAGKPKTSSAKPAPDAVPGMTTK